MLHTCCLQEVGSPAASGESCDTMYAEIIIIILPCSHRRSIQVYLPILLLPVLWTLYAHLPDTPRISTTGFQDVRYFSSILDVNVTLAYLSFCLIVCLINLHSIGQLTFHCVSTTLYTPASIYSSIPIVLVNSTKIWCDFMPYICMCSKEIISSVALPTYWRGFSVRFTHTFIPLK